MPSTPLLGAYGSLANTSISFRNVLINGGFDIWQRGTSQTGLQYGSDDRWINEHNGSTKTASRQTFTLGQTDVPGNPKYWSRTVVTSVAGVGNFTYKSQKIEGVHNLSGQQATLSFYAKADAAKNIAVEFVQDFGSGGSPSSAVTAIGVTTCALTTSWKLFTVPVIIPSIAGKTLGTNNNDCLQLVFWFEAGTNLNSRTNSLGQQSGTFDIANVQLEAGAQATPFEQRPIGTELSLCQRYTCLLSNLNQTELARMAVYTSGAMFFAVPFPVVMRGLPSFSAGTLTVLTTANTAQTGFSFSFNSTTFGSIYTIVAAKAAHGLTDGILASTNAIFSAEL